MFFFRSKKKQSEIYLIVSVEASHVRVAFVSTSLYQKPHVIAQHIGGFEGEITFENLLKILNVSLLSLFKKEPIGVDRVICVLGSPWYSSHINMFVRDEDVPFLFREFDAKKILKDSILEAQQKANEEFHSNTLVMLEKNILHIGVNGYSVESIKRDRVRRVEITSYVSFVPQKILTGIEVEISRHIKKDIVFHTSSLVHTVVSRDALYYLDTFVLVAVDGYHTEVGIISDGSLVFQTSFNGGDELLQKKAQSLGISPVTFQSEFRALTKNILHENAKRSILHVTHLASEEWRKSFYVAMQDIAKNIPLPKQVVVIAKPSSFFWIQPAIEDIRNKHVSASDTNLHAILVNGETLHDIVGSKIIDPDIKILIYSAFTTLKIQR